MPSAARVVSYWLIVSSLLIFGFLIAKPAQAANLTDRYACGAADQIQIGTPQITVEQGGCPKDGKTCTAYSHWVETDANGQAWCDNNKCAAPCSETTPIPAQPTITPTPSVTNPTPTQSELQKKWNPLPQTSYTTDNLMCDVLAKISGYCPYGETAVRKTDNNGKTVQLSLYNGTPGSGAIGGVTSVLASLYNPPTSTVEYLAGIGDNLGLGSPVYAQTRDVPGSGSSIIQPVLSLWQVIRNIAYLVYIVVFLAVGFMVMFRQKLNAQTVIGVQQALPGLVVGLILVTFSYFIAALIIDISFLGVQLMAQIFINAGPNVFNIQHLAQNSDILELFGSSMSRTISFSDSGDITNGLTHIIQSSPGTLGISAILTTITGIIIGTLIAPGMGTLIGAGAGLLGPLYASNIVGLLVPLVLTIALFIQLFRLLFALIGTYIQILVGTISGPFVILMSSIPGRGGGTSGWIKGLIANSLVFPAVFGAFLFAGFILATPQDSWRSTPPLFAQMSLDLIKVLIAYGILLGLPGIPDMVRGAFGIKPQQGGIVGAATAGFLGGVQGTQQIGGAAQGGIQLAYNAGRLNWLVDPLRNNLPRPIGRRIPPPIG